MFLGTIATHWRALSVARRAVILSLLTASALWIMFLARMWWQPIVADDHLVYASAVNWPNSPMRVNPPFYMYSVRLFFSIFGSNVGSARLPGVLAGFATLFLIPPVVVLVLGKSEQAEWTAALAVWLYTLSPQAVQNMMFIDIDTAFLSAALLALIWLWLKIEPLPAWQRIILLGLGFTLTLWVKLFSPVLTMGAICLFYLLQWRLRRFAEAVGAAFLGGAVFWLTFQSSLTSRYAFGYTGSYFSMLNILNPDNRRFIATVFPQGAGVVTLWLSVPIVILLAVAIKNSAQGWLKHQVDNVDELILYGSGCTLAYTLVIFPAWGYPRYQAPFTLILLLVSAITLAPALSQVARPAWKVLAAIAVACLAFNLLIVGDPLLHLYLVTFETNTGQIAARLKQGSLDALRMTALMPLALLIGFWTAPKLRVPRSAMLLAVTGILAVSGFAATTLIQINARYSTRYRYGYGLDDMLQAAQRVHDYVGPSGYIAAIDDVLFYTGRQGEGIYGLSTRSLMGEPSISLLDLMHRQRIDALVWTTKDAVRNPDAVHTPEIEFTLRECYNQETYGVFLVYLHKPGAACP